MKTRDDLPLFLSVSQAADVLGVSGTLISEAINAGRIDAIQLGSDHRSTRIRRDDLFPSEQAARDLTVKRWRRLHIASQDARRDALQKFRELEAALSEWERTERALDAELRLDDLDTETRALRAS